VSTYRSFRRALTWIALLAMASMALLPTISHALAQPGGPAPWNEICTSQGMSSMAVAGDASDAGKPPGSEPSLSKFEHCAFCGLGAGHLAPPAASRVELALPELSNALPALFPQAPYLLFAWGSAQPRGPPALS
jgi:hypothetical protein